MSAGINRRCVRLVLKNNQLWHKYFNRTFCIGYGGHLPKERSLKCESRHHQRLATCRKVCARDLSQMATQKKEHSPLRVLFFGTDQFALHHLKALHLNQLEGMPSAIQNLEVAICTGKCCVKRYADTHHLKTHSWPLPDLQGKYDVGVIVSFGHLIPARIINSFPLGVLNVHPSLLPAWRGASPLIATVLSGATTSGVSVMAIQPKKFDTGPLLAQRVVAIPDGITSFQLVDHMATHGTSMLVECLTNIQTIPRQPQPEESPTPRANKVKPGNAYINWESQCAVHIDRQYRAISELLPLRTRWRDRNVKLLEMASPDVFQAAWEKDLPDSALPGTAKYHRPTEALCVKCKDGWVGFRRIVLKKPMSALAFRNGYLTQPGAPQVIFSSQQNGLDYFWR